MRQTIITSILLLDQIVSQYSFSFVIYQIQFHLSSANKEKFLQCPFLESIKPTVKAASPEIVQDIFQGNEDQSEKGFYETLTRFLSLFSYNFIPNNN